MSSITLRGQSYPLAPLSPPQIQFLANYYVRRLCRVYGLRLTEIEPKHLEHVARDPEALAYRLYLQAGGQPGGPLPLSLAYALVLEDNAPAIHAALQGAAIVNNQEPPAAVADPTDPVAINQRHKAVLDQILQDLQPPGEAAEPVPESPEGR